MSRTILKACGALAMTTMIAVAVAARPLPAGPEVTTVHIEAASSGFVPDTVRLVAGAPADLVFTRTATSGCVAQVHIPDLGVGKTALPLGEPVAIRVAPEKPGEYEFRCGMDMRKGTIIVSPKPSR
jgi:plastocyanin domain-containing protein